MTRFDRVIPPGVEGTVSLEINTDHLKGKQTKGVTVFSNDPQWPELRLLLTARVKAVLDITPADYAYLRISEGQTWRHTFKIMARENRPFRIKKIVIPDGKFSVTQERIEGRKPGYELTVSASGDIPPGPVRAAIQIHTDLPGAGKVELRIFGKVEGPIAYYPERLSFYPNQGVMDGQFSVVVNMATSQKALTVRAVEKLPPQMQWSLIPVTEGRNYVMVFVWTGGKIDKRIHGEAVITTDHEDMPAITIPYDVYPGKY